MPHRNRGAKGNKKKKCSVSKDKVLSTTSVMMTALAAGATVVTAAVKGADYSTLIHQNVHDALNSLLLFVKSSHTFPIVASIPGFGDHTLNITIALAEQFPDLVNALANAESQVPSYASFIFGGLISGPTIGLVANFALAATVIGLLYRDRQKDQRITTLEQQSSRYEQGYMMLPTNDSSDSLGDEERSAQATLQP